MAFCRRGWFLCLLAAPLSAATIVPTDTSVTLQTGDTLTFNISAYSYLVHASALGAPADPSTLTFSLLTDPLLASFDLAVSLESYSRAASTPAVTASQLSGAVDGSLYDGPVTLASGSFSLSPALSSQLFSGPAVLLSVENLGPAVTLGLAPYTLLESTEVSLSGGDLNVGAVVASATLVQAPPLTAATLDQPVLVDQLAQFTEVSDVPEPSSAVMLALAAAFLLLNRGQTERSLKLPTSRTRD